MQLAPMIGSRDVIEAQDFISILKKPQPRHWHLDLDVELSNATLMLVFLQKYLLKFMREVLLTMSVVIYFLNVVDSCISAAMQSSS